MSENPIHQCIHKANEFKIAAAERTLSEMSREGWSRESPWTGFSLKGLGGKGAHTLARKIALTPVGLLLTAILALLTPFAYVGYLRKLARRKVELREEIRRLGVESVRPELSAMRTLSELWSHYGLKEGAYPPGLGVDLLCDWVDILYGPGCSAALSIRERERELRRRNVSAKEAYYKGMPGAVHFVMSPPIETLLKQLSEELPPIRGSNQDAAADDRQRDRTASKETIAFVMTDTLIDLFDLYGVSQPTDAQTLKASVYTCIAAISILNDIGGGRRELIQPLIDSIVKEGKGITESLSMQIADLGENRGAVEKVLRYFPEHMGLTGSTTVNGLAAFEALYNANVERLVSEISSHRGGPLGVTGYAAIVVVEAVFGEGKSNEHFPEIAMRFARFTERLAAAT